MLVVTSYSGSKKKLIAVINNRLFIFKPRKASLKDTGRDQSCIFLFFFSTALNYLGTRLHTKTTSMMDHLVLI